MNKFVTWRRVIWYGLLVASGWGLYLFVPPKPRWTLPENEVPLRISATRVLTMVVDPLQKEQFGDLHRSFSLPAWYQPSPPEVDMDVLGPVRLRDLQSGQIVGIPREPRADDSLLTRISSGLRFAMFTEKGNSAILVHDFETGKHWNMPKLPQPEFSPTGKLVLVETSNRTHRVLDAASGQTVVELPLVITSNDDVGPDFWGPDDSWLLCTRSGQGDDAATHWMMWDRASLKVSKGTLPGTLYHFSLAPNGCLAVLSLAAPDQLILWDVSNRKEIRSLKSSNGCARVSFSPDGKKLAAWSETHEGGELEFFEIGTGERTSVRIAGTVSKTAYSADGQLIAFLQEAERHQSLAVVRVSNLEELWRQKTPQTLHSLDWLRGNCGTELKLVASFAGHYGKATIGCGLLVYNAIDGQVLVRRPRGHSKNLRLSPSDGVLVGEPQRLVLQDDSRERDNGKYTIVETIQRWLPWTKDSEFEYLTIENASDGSQLLERTYRHALMRNPRVQWRYCDSNTLVLCSDGRDTEIWDLPPPKRWLWILGPPAGLAVLPWLRSKLRRKRPSEVAPNQANPIVPTPV